jgi:hypothetical protein
MLTIRNIHKITLEGLSIPPGIAYRLEPPIVEQECYIFPLTLVSDTQYQPVRHFRLYRKPVGGLYRLDLEYGGRKTLTTMIPLDDMALANLMERFQSSLTAVLRAAT